MRRVRAARASRTLLPRRASRGSPLHATPDARRPSSARFGVRARGVSVGGRRGLRAGRDRGAGRASPGAADEGPERRRVPVGRRLAECGGLQAPGGGVFSSRVMSGVFGGRTPKSAPNRPGPRTERASKRLGGGQVVPKLSKVPSECTQQRRLTFENEKKVSILSRFVRVILAQGPC